MRNLRDRFPSVTFLAAGLAAALPLAAQCAPQLLPGEPLGTPSGSDGSVTLVWDPDGVGPAPEMLVLGGSLFVDAATRGSVLAYDGTRWQAIGTPPLGACTALGLFGGRLIAAVSRSSTSSDIAAWDGATWQVVGGLRGVAHAMTLFQGRLVVGGTFSHVDGLPASNVAQWDGSTWQPLGVSAGGVGGSVLALADYFGSLYVGGDIPHASGIPVANLAVWDGSAWSAGARFNGTVRALTVRNASATLNSFLFAGGDFSTGDGVPLDRVARFNLLSGWAQAGSGLPSGECSALYVRGFGLSAYELTAGLRSASSPIVRLSGATWIALGTRASGNVASLALFAFRYVASFTSGLPLVRALDNGEWLPVSGAGIDGNVRAVHATATDVVIGGDFTSLSGVRMNGIARGRVGAWQALGGGVNGSVSVVTTLANGDVIAAGDFTAAGGVSANGIARWDGTSWSALGAGVTGSVFALAVMANGDLVTGGSITHAGGQPVNRIARWNGSAWSPLGFGLDESVYALAVHPGGELFVGGLFTTAGGLPSRGLARWTGSAWSAMPVPPNAAVMALAVLPNGEVLVGGFFDALGPVGSNYIARWNGAGWIAVPGFVQSFFSHVRALVRLPNGEALVSATSGNAPFIFFARFDGQAVAALAPATFSFNAGALAPSGEVILTNGYTHRLVSPCPAVANVYGPTCSGSGGSNVLIATELPWIGTTFRSEARGMPAAGLALAVTGVAATSIPIASFLRQGVPGCNVLATPDVVAGLVPRAGRAISVVPVPALPELVNQVLYHQVIALELDAGNQVVAVTSTNGLRLTIGVL